MVNPSCHLMCGCVCLFECVHACLCVSVFNAKSGITAIYFGMIAFHKYAAGDGDWRPLMLNIFHFDVI